MNEAAVARKHSVRPARRAAGAERRGRGQSAVPGERRLAHTGVLFHVLLSLGFLALAAGLLQPDGTSRTFLAALAVILLAASTGAVTATTSTHSN